MLNLALLPATEPGDKTFGEIPDRIGAHPRTSVLRVSYPTLVWYNKTVRDEAIAQIRAWGVTPVVLVGFSKSGLGAWNIARMIPDLVSGTIIFDAPVARKRLPPWGTAPFYGDDRTWQDDLPICTTQEFAQVMPHSHRLVLIAGAAFHEEMRALSQALLQIGCEHVFLDRWDTKHDWNSGWLEEGLSVLLERTPAGDVLKAAPEE